MQRILIADSSSARCKALSKQLSSEFEVLCCNDGQQALEMIFEYNPDLLAIDMMITGVNALDVMNAVRSSGHSLKILAITSYDSDYVSSRLHQLKIDMFCRLPCQLDSMVCSIRQLAKQPALIPWCVEDEIDNALTLLGFRAGFGMYENTYNAILLKYHCGETAMVKDLYPAIAAKCGGTEDSVEKSIRDAIRGAWKDGNRAIWRLYFAFGEGEKRPSSEMFVGRIARILQARERIQKPCKSEKEQAKEA